MQDDNIYVYDEDTYNFTQTCKKMAQSIAGNHNLFTPRGGLECPNFDVKVFDDRPHQLGFCQRISWDYYVIGINKDFLYEGENCEKLRKTLIHEIAHLVAIFNNNDFGHGANFINICSILGDASAAKMGSLKTSSKIRYKRMRARNHRIIDKLLALTGSSNVYESELAQKKLNNLLVKYNVKSMPKLKKNKRIYGAIIHEEKLEEVPYYIAMMCKIISLHGAYSVITKTGLGFFVEITGDYNSVEYTKSLWDSIMNNAMAAFTASGEDYSALQYFISGYVRGIYRKLVTHDLSFKFYHRLAKNNEELRALTQKIVYNNKVSRINPSTKRNKSFHKGVKSGHKYSYKKMIS